MLHWLREPRSALYVSGSSHGRPAAAHGRLVVGGLERGRAPGNRPFPPAQLGAPPARSSPAAVRSGRPARDLPGAGPLRPGGVRPLPGPGLGGQLRRAVRPSACRPGLLQLRDELRRGAAAVLYRRPDPHAGRIREVQEGGGEPLGGFPGLPLPPAAGGAGDRRARWTGSCSTSCRLRCSAHTWAPRRTLRARPGAPTCSSAPTGVPTRTGPAGRPSGRS